MGFMKPREIRAMSPEERRKKLEELRAELVALRAQAAIAGGTVASPARIRQLRRAIARILTMEREEQLKRGRERA